MGVAAATDSNAAVVLQALTLLIGQRLLRELQDDRGVPVHLVPRLFPLNVLPHDFFQGGQLIDRAVDVTSTWLAAGMPPGADWLLQPHHRPI